MNKSRKEWVEEFCEKIRAGEMDFSQVRATLSANGNTEEDINEISRRVDRDLNRMAQKDAERAKGKQMFIGGLILMNLGILITALTYFGIINMGNRFLFAYGPILAGITLTLLGKMKMDR